MEYVIRLERVAGPNKYVLWVTRLAGSPWVNVAADRYEWGSYMAPTWDDPSKYGPEHEVWDHLPTPDSYRWDGVVDPDLCGLVKQAAATGWSPVADRLAELGIDVLSDWAAEPGWEIHRAHFSQSADDINEGGRRGGRRPAHPGRTRPQPGVRVRPPRGPKVRRLWPFLNPRRVRPYLAGLLHRALADDPIVLDRLAELGGVAADWAAEAGWEIGLAEFRETPAEYERSLAEADGSRLALEGWSWRWECPGCGTPGCTGGCHTRDYDESRYDEPAEYAAPACPSCGNAPCCHGTDGPDECDRLIVPAFLDAAR